MKNIPVLKILAVLMLFAAAAWILPWVLLILVGYFLWRIFK